MPALERVRVDVASRTTPIIRYPYCGLDRAARPRDRSPPKFRNPARVFGFGKNVTSQGIPGCLGLYKDNTVPLNSAMSTPATSTVKSARPTMPLSSKWALLVSFAAFCPRAKARPAARNFAMPKVVAVALIARGKWVMGRLSFSMILEISCHISG